MLGPMPERQKGGRRAHDSAGQPAKIGAGRRPVINSASVSCASAEVFDHKDVVSMLDLFGPWCVSDAMWKDPCGGMWSMRLGHAS